MMADLLIEAHYLNNERTTIEAIWKGAQGEYTAYIQVNPEDIHYKQLLEQISLDDLDKQSWDWHKKQRKVYEDAIKQIYLAENPDGAPPDKANKWKVFFKTLNEDVSEEDLFKLKLDLFEHDKIKASKNRKQKADLRKAETFKEVVMAYCKIE